METDKDTLRKSIKDEYDLAVIVMNDMSTLLYTRGSELTDVGVMGFAFTILNDIIKCLEWLSCDNDKYEIKEHLNINNFLVHHTLKSAVNGSGEDMLTIIEEIRRGGKNNNEA